MSTYADDINFVLSETVRFANLTIAELQKLSFEDAMSNFPHPSGKGSMHCGARAEECLRHLSELAISRSRFASRIKVGPVIKELKKIIVDRFVNERRQLSDREAEKAVSAAIRHVGKRITDQTILLPCHLTDDTVPDSFVIGPVSFRQHRLVFNEIEPALDAYLKEGPKDATYIREILAKDAREYYGSFKWIAEVQIIGFSPDRANERAAQIVQSAVNCIHLLIGAGHSHRLRLGGPNYHTDVRSNIRVDREGKLDLTTSRSWEGHRWEDDWWKSLQQRTGDLISLMGTAIVTGHEIPKNAPLARRFVDASTWYGEAVRDKFPASRMIKYMTAVERIVTTKNEEGLSETISRRGAALLTMGGIGNFQNDAKRIKVAYDKRSELIHGSTSPSEPKMGTALREAEFLSRKILLCSLLFFGKKGLEALSVSEAEMERNYAKIISLADKSVFNKLARST